jgi:alanine racemase
VRATWLEIDLEAIVDNVREIRRFVGKETEMMAVVKANAYGHGAARVGKVVLANGADRLGVAILDEAIRLRNYGITAPIVILGHTTNEEMEKVVRYDLIQTIYTVESAKALSQAAVWLGKEAVVHVKVDTGMGRIGFLPDDNSIRAIVDISYLPGIKIEGIYTHFASADDPDRSFTREQLASFREFVARLRQAGVRIPVLHAANSAATINLPEAHLNLVRPGLIVYGLYPSPCVDRKKLNLRPALSWKAIVTLVKDVPPGMSIIYGRTSRTAAPSVVATVPVGYGDGYPRALSNRGEVLVHGRRARGGGRGCMDQFMLDVTHIPGVKTGDEVVIIGRQGQGAVTAEEYASWWDTINYEAICMINERVPRVYLPV